MNRRTMLSRSFLAGAFPVALRCSVALAEASNAEGDPPPPDLRIALRLSALDGGKLTPGDFDDTAAIIRDRALALHSDFAQTRSFPPNRLVVHATGVDDVETAVTVLTTRGLVEIINPAGDYLEEGTIVSTSINNVPSTFEVGVPGATKGPIYETIITSTDIEDAFATTNSLNQVVVGFRIKYESWGKIFTFTSENIGEPMSIVVDNRVISTATINGAIEGQGIIEGLELFDVRTLVIQLNLKPVQARIEVERTVVNPERGRSSARHG